MNKMPTPPGFERSGELNDNESSFILDSTLKPKHRSDTTILAFIESFVRCKSIAQASAECGIKPSLGYMYRHRQDIANAIQKIIDKSAIKYGFDATEIMERAKEIVDFDPINVQNPDGTFKSKMYEIDPETRRNIKSLKVKNLFQQVKDMNGMDKKIIIGEVIEYEFYDKLKAIDLVGKEKEMFKNTTRVEHTITKDMASILLASAQRGQQETINYNNKNVIDVESSKVEE